MAETVETTGGPADKKAFLARLKDLLKRIWAKKSEEDAAHKHKEEHHDSHGEDPEEVRKSREMEEKRKAEMKYKETSSSQIQKVQADVYNQTKQNEVADLVQATLAAPQSQPESAEYFIRALSNADVRDSLVELVRSSTNAALAVEHMLKEGDAVHNNPFELIKTAQTLVHEASKLPGGVRFQPLIVELGNRAKEQLWDQYTVQRAMSQRHGMPEPSMANILESDSSVVMTDQEKKILSDIKREGGRSNDPENHRLWDGAVDTMLSSNRYLKGRDAEWVRQAALPDADIEVDKKIVDPINRIWTDVEKAAIARELTPDDYSEFEKRILEAESGIYPTDVQAGTEAYYKKLRDIKAYTEKKLNALADKITKGKDVPGLKESNIKDEAKFLNQYTRAGILSDLFDRNPEMKSLFFSTGVRAGRFRQRVFLKLHSTVLADGRNSSQDNFNLYERMDMTSFLRLLKEGFSDVTHPETGQSLGKMYSDYFNNLSNTIRQSRDIDYWASQPAANYENFNRSLGMFQNEYTYQALGIPAVSAAFRAYEITLRSIYESNDGYIPPQLIEYDARNNFSYWNQESEEMFKSWISKGSVHDLERDREYYLHSTKSDGHTPKVDWENPLELDFASGLDQDEVAMYMLLAKGMGMASQRFIEMMAQTRIPGHFKPEMGLDGFHSIPYEGMTTAMNFYNVFLHKWRAEAWKYFYLLNQVIPETKKKIKVGSNDSKEAMRAYELYQRADGSFEEEYGDEAKRWLDLSNMSRVSSAIGQETLWRQYDSTVGRSDKYKEFLGGPTRLALSGRFAEIAVKNEYIVKKYREEYRNTLRAHNANHPDAKLPTAGSGFEKLWQDNGIKIYQGRIEREWDEFNGKDIKKGALVHTSKTHENEHLVNSYKTALKTRIWAEMAMRNPLVVAHGLKVSVPLAGIETEVKKPRKISLHKVLVYEILGIRPEDLKFGEFDEPEGTIRFGGSPTEEQRKLQKEVLVLEGDLGAVKQAAVDRGRDLTEDDFRIIGDEKRRNNAIEYWKKVRQALLGTDNINEGQRIIEEIGMDYLLGTENYEWNHEKIHKNIPKLFESLSGRSVSFKWYDGQVYTVPCMLEKAVNTDTEWILGTDDMSFMNLDMLNLGSRQWLRRGGDVAAHDAGGKMVVEYMAHGLKPTPDKHKLAEFMEKINDAYAGDMKDYGWNMNAFLAYTTDRLYAWDKKRFGSAAQLDLWQTKRGVSAWMANGRREWWDAIEHMDILPPNAHIFGFKSFIDNVDVHTLRKWCHADNTDVWKEIIFLGMLIAIGMTVYKAFTAPSEEESGSSGHH